MTLYIVRDAIGNLLTKDLSWTMECASTNLFKTPHKDVALNQLLELNASDITLRAQIVTCEVDKRNRPVISNAPATA